MPKFMSVCSEEEQQEAAAIKKLYKEIYDPLKQLKIYPLLLVS